MKRNSYKGIYTNSTVRYSIKYQEFTKMKTNKNYRYCWTCRKRINYYSNAIIDYPSNKSKSIKKQKGRNKAMFGLE